MKKLLAGALALSLLGGTAALAEPHGDWHGHDGRGYADRGHDDRHGGWDRSDRGRGWDGDRRGDRDGGWDRGDRGRGWDHGRGHWVRGGYLPRAYWDRPYWVDYRYYHLRRPPYGYRWVRVNDEYVLAAITTGLILEAFGDR